MESDECASRTALWLLKVSLLPVIDRVLADLAQLPTGATHGALLMNQKEVSQAGYKDVAVVVDTAMCLVILPRDEFDRAVANLRDEWGQTIVATNCTVQGNVPLFAVFVNNPEAPASPPRSYSGRAGE
jgi:hypothetical protein